MLPPFLDYITKCGVNLVFMCIFGKRKEHRMDALSEFE